MPRTRLAPAVAACLLAAATAADAPAGDTGRLFRGIAAPIKAIHRQRPPSGCDDRVEELAAQIDWLKHHIDAHGSIVAKEPDVWGQSRLLRHRAEYEDQLRRQLGLFTERTTAAIRRSDQAFVGMALAIQSAAGGRRGPQDVAVPDVAPSNNVITSIQGLLPTTNESVGRSDPVVIARTAPFAIPSAPAGFQFDDAPLSLEPTVHLDQMSRYISHLQQLRRVNEGDDTADSPGYSLNLVRIPVSIRPGKHTRKGHGAEITLTAEPCLGDDLLPTTFRNLVVNDLVDIVAPALTWCVNDPACVAWAETIAGSDAGDLGAAPDEPGRRRGVRAAMESLAARLPAGSPAAAPAVKTRRARLPIPFSQLADVSGMQPIAILIRDTRTALGGHPASRPCIHYLDVRGHLAEELDAAADFLALPEHRHLWGELPAWNLAALVRGRRSAEIAAVRCRFFESLGPGSGPLDAEVIDRQGSPDGTEPGVCCGADAAARPLCRTTTAALAWGILVESALLDERLAEDMRESATAQGRLAPAGACSGPFFGPDPAPGARAAFNDYVRARWPIRVFALDPVREEQNVEDSYARRRELQIALALAAASGRLNAQAMARTTRRLEAEIATVALNQTAVGFSHGADTFGWRFYPRVQSPPVRGTLATITETVCGGPTTDGDLMQRQLEPGQRECTAIIVMPAFVPSITLDVRTHWFSLAHPAASDPSMRRTMQLSRAVQSMRSSAAACTQCAHLYRDGEVHRLLRSVDQLDRELPLQTLRAQVPYENTAGGFELFTTGVTDLAPELVGWYGGPGVDPAATTTLFLVGRGFSLHDTRVIAGGRPAAIRLVSREVLEVAIPPGAQTLGAIPCGPGFAARPYPAEAAVPAAVTELLPLPAPAPAPSPATILPAAPAVSAALLPSIDVAAGCPAACNDREVVDIHLATPYGVSGHLLVPVSRARAADEACVGPAFEAACTIGLTFTATKTAGSRTETARIDEFFTSPCDALAIRVPATFIPPPKAVLQLLLRDSASGATVAAASFDDPFFDARNSRYLLAGGDLRNFVGDTSRPATDKTIRGAVKPYLDALLARGALADDGDAVSLVVTATIAAGQSEVPVAGGLAVEVTRRGKTVVEPKPEAAIPTEP